MSDMKIAVLGAGGRMGQALARVLADTPGCALPGGIEAKGSPYVGRDIGEVAGLEPVGIAITEDPLPVFAAVDGVLDFTTPASTLEFVALSAQARLVHVIGTTGLSAADEAKIEAAARHATIVKAGDLSLGVNLLAALTARVARGARRRIRHRDLGDAPQAQARRAVRHLADARAAAPGGQGRLASRSRRYGPATATPARAATAISALPHCAAATWWASTG